MKRRFCLREYFVGRKGTFLAVQFTEDSETTYERFVIDYSGSHGDLLDDVADRISRMAKKTGIRDGFFKDEGEHCVARFKGTGDLRIFCLKYGSACIVLGQGGLKKNVRTYQQVPSLYNAVKTLRKIDQRLKDEGVDFTNLLDYVDIEMEIDL